jgi:hypothetical protein
MAKHTAIFLMAILLGEKLLQLGLVVKVVKTVPGIYKGAGKDERYMGNNFLTPGRQVLPG